MKIKAISQALCKPIFWPFALVMFLSGCANLPPDGPSIIALPGTGKSLDQFVNDDRSCRSFAVSAASSGKTAWSMQRGYDAAYVQCMYSLGNRVPVSGSFSGVASGRDDPIPAPPPGTPPPAPPLRAQ